MTVTAKVPQTPLGPLLQSFFVEHLCSHKRVSPRTVESYRDTFRLLLQHLQAKSGKKPSALSIGDLDAPVILSFLENLEQQRHNQAQSRNVRLTAIRSFFRLVTLRDPASIGIATRVLAIPLKRTDQRLVGYLTRAEVDAILAANNLSEWSGRRDHVLLLTLYNTGARVSEIISLLQPQFSIGTKSFVQFNGKGRKERSVPLWPTTTAKALKEWFSESGDRSPAVAFPNARGSSLTRDGVDYILQQAIERAVVNCPSLNNKRVSPHIVRHYLPFRTMSGNREPMAIWPGDSRLRRGKPQRIARHSLVSSTSYSGRRGVDHRVCNAPVFHRAGRSWQALSPSWQVSLRDKSVWFQHVRDRATMRSQNDRRLLAGDPWPWCASSDVR
jgi:integrase/recombinase XerD